MRIFVCFLALLVPFASAFEGYPNFIDGRKVIVHLFEWKWTDIAEECERYLGPYGFAGVQVSPPAEHNMVWDPWRPWYERYQPISYELISRSGNEAEFSDMVKRCRDVGVLIYVDAVINHMAAFSYDFPKVPYSNRDFNVPMGKCPSADGSIDNYGDPVTVRNCNLVGLNDILFGADTNYYPDTMVADYLNKMIGMGVAGFRIDAAKHMWPGDMKNILGRVQNTWDGSRPYVYQEVIDRSDYEAIRAWDYVDIGDVTEFRYCDMIEGLGRGTNPAVYFQSFGEAWGMLHTDHAFVFVDNHDNQRNHGGGGNILTYKDSTPYKKALAFGMAWDYGTFRIMSSFHFDYDDSSPPAYNGDDYYPDGHIMSPIIYEDGTCGNGWVCEHRWRQIRNMACFRNAAGWEPVANWWSNGDNFIAFSRGSNAFFALNNQNYHVSARLQTGLPAGVYCDVISSDPTDNGCSNPNSYITVDDYGYADIYLHNGEDSMIAIHIGARAGSGGGGCSW